jgi:DNA invertase Pin-like site-specific DNA recombinase
MLIGYARVSKVDDSQILDLQIDALIEAGIEKRNIYTDKISGVKDDRPGLENCLKAVRENDTLVVWKLDRLGRNLKHLIGTVDDLNNRKIGFKVLTGQGINIDTTNPAGKMIFAIFGAFAEFERDLIRERTIAGLKAARARGRKGGRKFQLTKAQVRLAQVAMQNRDTSVAELCKELGITRPTLYRYVGPNGELREFGEKVLNNKV